VSDVSDGHHLERNFEKFYLERLFWKVSVRSRSQLVDRALGLGPVSGRSAEPPRAPSC